MKVFVQRPRAFNTELLQNDRRTIERPMLFLFLDMSAIRNIPSAWYSDVSKFLKGFHYLNRMTTSCLRFLGKYIYNLSDRENMYPEQDSN